MKKTIIILALFSMLAAPAAAREPTEDRRTLHAAFGQKNMIFEAPANMCFLDETIPEQAAVLAGMKAYAAEKGRHVLMAVFADCYQMSALGQTDDPIALPDMGMVMWMNPYIGEKVSMAEADYLEMREDSMPQYMAQSLKNYPQVELDPQVLRNDAGIMLAYTSNMEIEYQKYTVTGVTAAAMIAGHPVDFSLVHTSKTQITQKGRLYDLMDKFLLQQAALNKTR